MKELEEETEECPDCEGSGEIYTTSPSQCTVYRNDCCGGCFGEVECETCNGTGEIEKDDEK
jgi:DnaJ-class molecular chaperone